MVKTLTNAVAAGTVSHAYLFTGPRGTGKTSTARLLAKAVNGVDDQDSDLAKEIAAGHCMDVVEMDAASESGVDDVRRSIVEAANYRPTQLKYKVYIIDEVHDLSGKAFDALLKTIEEPPAHVIFVLATTEYHKVPPTIRSRCQRFTFHRAKITDLVSRLAHVTEKEGRSAEDAALSIIARMADGSFRDALTLLEQVLLTSEGTVTAAHVYDQLGLINDEAIDKLSTAISCGDGEEVVKTLEEFSNLGRDPRAILDSITYRLADLTRAAYGVPTQSGLDAAQETALRSTAQRVGLDKLIEIRARVAELGSQIRDVSLPKLFLESSLLGLAVELNRKIEAPKAAPQEKAAVVREATAVKEKPEEQKVKESVAAPSGNGEAATSDAADKAVSAEPVAQAEPAQSADGDAEVDQGLAKAQRAWVALVADLSAKSPAFAERFSGESTRVTALAGDVARVEISKPNLGWLESGAKRMDLIQDAWAKSSPGIKLDFIATSEKKKNLNVAVKHVEAVLTGEALVNKVKETFEVKK